MKLRSQSSGAPDEDVFYPSDEVPKQYQQQYSFPPGNKWSKPELSCLNVTVQRNSTREIRSLSNFIMSRSTLVVPDALKQCIPPSENG
jgi:hypothetical protein